MEFKKRNYSEVSELTHSELLSELFRKYQISYSIRDEIIREIKVGDASMYNEMLSLIAQSRGRAAAEDIQNCIDQITDFSQPMLSFDHRA